LIYWRQEERDKRGETAGREEKSIKLNFFALITFFFLKFSSATIKK